MEDRLKKLQRFLNFWFAPWGAAKGEVWESFSGDRPFSEASARVIVHAILEGKDGAIRINWKEMDMWERIQN